MKFLKFIAKLFLMILLAPVWLLLTVLIGIFSFLIGIASWIFCLIAIVLAIIGIVVLITETFKDGLFVLFIAYLFSPWGIPMFANWVISKFILFKDWLTERVYKKWR